MRRLVIALALALALAGCNGRSFAPIDDPVADAPSPRALGMNDVSILLPLPVDPDVPVLASLDVYGAAPLAPKVAASVMAFASDVHPSDGAPYTIDQYQVVAVRFDLCSRSHVGACHDDEDGRVRLVLQGVYRGPDGRILTHDVALHAFYPIPNAELPGVIAELRAMAAIHDVALTEPLQVDAAKPAYLDPLRALVLRYAHADALVRLTAIGQKAGVTGFRWQLRGVDIDATGALTSVPIPGTTESFESLDITGGDTVYSTEPEVVAPVGFSLVESGVAYNAAAMGDKLVGLQALAAVDNPSSHDTVDVPCVTCHVATFLTFHRSDTAGIDPASLVGNYQTPWNTTVTSLANTEPRLVRAFGWMDASPVISIRVANETARVLTEIDARDPMP